MGNIPGNLMTNSRFFFFFLLWFLYLSLFDRSLFFSLSFVTILNLFGVCSIPVTAYPRCPRDYYHLEKVLCDTKRLTNCFIILHLMLSEYHFGIVSCILCNRHYGGVSFSSWNLQLLNRTVLYSQVLYTEFVTYIRKREQKKKKNSEPDHRWWSRRWPNPAVAIYWKLLKL